MEFTTTRQTLEEVLYAAQRAVNPRSPLPIATGVLLSAKNERLTATGTDLEITISKSVAIERVTDEGSIVVPGKFYEIVKRLPKGPVHIKTGNNEITITYGKQQVKASTLPVNEFPKAPTIESKSNIVLDTSDFINAIEKVYFACSSTHPNLAGVFFDITPSGVEFVATDSHRLNQTHLSGIGLEAQAIVPRRALEETKVLQGERTAITVGENLIAFASDNVTIVSRIVDGNYINYKIVIPREISTRIKICTNELISTLDRAVLLQKEGVPMVFLNIKNGEMAVSAINESFSLNETLQLAEHEGKAIKVCFNTKYLLDSLKVCDEDPYLCFSTGPSIKIEDEDFSSLILAIRTSMEKVA